MGRAAAPDANRPLGAYREAARPLIGVDIDGVLGDQITAIVPHVREQFGIELRFEDVTTYTHPLADGRHVGHVLAKTMTDEAFVTSLPVHPGAAEMLAALRQLGRVKIITVRPQVAGPWTERWLHENALSFDEFMLAEAERKSLGGTDVLIDDYLGNVREFLAATDGVAVLVSRPWNQEADERAELEATGRFAVAERLEDVPGLVAGLLDAPPII